MNLLIAMLKKTCGCVITKVFKLDAYSNVISFS